MQYAKHFYLAQWFREVHTYWQRLTKMKAAMPDLPATGPDGEPLSPKSSAKGSKLDSSNAASAPAMRLNKLIRILDSSKQQLLMWIQVFLLNFPTLSDFFEFLQLYY